MIARADAVRSRIEVVLVLLLSLGASAVYAVVSLIAKLTAGPPLSQQTATLNPSQSPRPYLDLTYQLLGIFFALVPVAAGALSAGPRSRSGARPRLPAGPAATSAGASRWPRPSAFPGLLLVYVAAQLGLNAQIVPAALQPVWWAVPVLILAAVENAILEEVIVVGYLMTRLRRAGHGGSGWWSPARPCCAAPTTCTRASAPSSATR